MKKYVELIIKGEDKDISLLVKELKSFSSEAFKFNEICKSDAISDGYYIEMLAKRSLDYRSRIVLIITHDHLRVCNIIPKTVSFLEIEQYNSVLQHFYDEVICHIQTYNLNVNITKEDNSMQDLISEPAYKALVLWEDLCNKNSPTGHPNDQERWIDFICEMYINNDHLALCDFKNWLIEDKGWCYDASTDIDKTFLDLEHDIEFGLDLLMHYAKKAHIK